MIRSMNPIEFETFLAWLDNRIDIVTAKRAQEAIGNGELLAELLRKNTEYGRKILVGD